LQQKNSAKKQNFSIVPKFVGKILSGKKTFIALGLPAISLYYAVFLITREVLFDEYIRERMVLARFWLLVEARIG
jgi:hypothetical protein